MHGDNSMLSFIHSAKLLPSRVSMLSARLHTQLAWHSCFLSTRARGIRHRVTVVRVQAKKAKKWQPWDKRGQCLTPNQISQRIIASTAGRVAASTTWRRKYHNLAFDKHFNLHHKLLSTVQCPSLDSRTWRPSNVEWCGFPDKHER
jgi:hypothetical protein